MKKIVFAIIILYVLLFIYNYPYHVNNNIPIVDIYLNGVDILDVNNGDKDIEYYNNILKIKGDRTKYKIIFKGRGNRTWLMEKKPYQVSFDEKTSILGLPKSKKFVFLANYFDNSLVKNDFSLRVANKSGIKYTNVGKFIDLYIDRKYMGNYYVVPKVSLSSSSVNLNGDKAILVELDNSYYKDERFSFLSDTFKDHLVLKDSESESFKEDFDNFKSKYNLIEKYIEEKNYSGLEEILDVESMAIHYLIIEFSSNDDSLRSSFYMYMNDYKDRIHVGPLWDYDFAYDIDRSPSTMFVRNKVDFGDTRVSNLLSNLLEINEFDELVHDIWNNRLSGIYAEEISNLDNTYKSIKKSGVMNNSTWNFRDYNESYSLLRKWLIERYNYFNDYYGSDNYE